jgi:hypothetical protein
LRPRFENAVASRRRASLSVFSLLTNNSEYNSEHLQIIQENESIIDELEAKMRLNESKNDEIDNFLIKMSARRHERSSLIRKRCSFTTNTFEKYKRRGIFESNMDTLRYPHHNKVNELTLIEKKRMLFYISILFSIITVSIIFSFYALFQL